MVVKGNHVLVHRKNPRPMTYVRRYPADYTGEKDVHPNKLSTWLNFSQSAKEKRGEKNYEEHIDLMRRLLTGDKIKEKEEPLALDEEERVNLKIQALNKGLSPESIDQLTRPKKPEWYDILFPQRKASKSTSSSILL